jgi:hypothetical protein
MGLRRQLGALAVVALAIAPASHAGPLDACAQRVIRDWYSGGRVDDVYPLACYRAALRALPADVLQYSSADQDIRRALAYARRGRDDPGNGPAPPAAPAPSPAPAAPQEPATPSTQPPGDPARKRPAPKPTPKPEPAPGASETAAPARAAQGATERPSASASVPDPILVLTALAAVLLATGGGTWLLSRRR